MMIKGDVFIEIYSIIMINIHDLCFFYVGLRTVGMYLLKGWRQMLKKEKKKKILALAPS